MDIIGPNLTLDATFGISNGYYYTDSNNNVYDDSSGTMTMIGSNQSTVEAAKSGDPSALEQVSNLAAILPQILVGWNALQLSQLNMQRAKSGLPPLNPAVYGPQVSVGLNQQTMLYIGGALVVGFLLLRK